MEKSQNLEGKLCDIKAKAKNWKIALKMTNKAKKSHTDKY